MIIFALKDTKLGFMSPFTFQNVELAKRYFINCIKSSDKSLISINPEDFELYQIGEYNLSSGEVMSDVKFIMAGIDVINMSSSLPSQSQL